MTDSTAGSQRQEFEEFETFCSDVDDKHHGWKTELGSGSITELMPFFNPFGNAELDFDILLLVDHIVAVPPKSNNDDVTHASDSSDGQLEEVEIRSNETQNGYVKLYRHSKKAYLTISELNRKESRLTQYDKIILGGHGPASKTELPTSAMGPKSPLVLTGFDNVHFVRCMHWPTIADEWKTRNRSSGWPSQSLVARCVDLGCLFVPAAHVTSTERETEFRYSFSFTEMLLVRSWSPMQKYLYNTLKQMKNKVRKRLHDDRTVSEDSDMYLRSYHVKTVMFWACEERTKEFWNKGNVASVLKELVDDVIERLSNRKCLHYFIRSINLFDESIADEAKMIPHIVDGLREEVESLCGGKTVTTTYALRTVVRPIVTLPDIVIKWLQLRNVDPIVTAKASMFELYDLYLALNYQKLIQNEQQTAANNNVEVSADNDLGSAAEKHFELAVKRFFPQVMTLNLELSTWEDVVTSAARAVYWDKSFEKLVSPLTERRDESYPAFLASKLGDKLDEIEEFVQQEEQRKREGVPMIPYNNSSGFDWERFAKEVLPVRQSWFGAMAYYANYNYMQSTDDRLKRALDLCDEAIKLHVELQQREFKLLWYYEGSYAVTLSNQLSSVYDKLVQSVIARAKTSLPVPICPISFMYYIKVRSLIQLHTGQSDVVRCAMDEWLEHMEYKNHVDFYPNSKEFEKQLYNDIAAEL